MTRTDRVLLSTLLPVFALCFSLHLKEVVRTGLAQPPVFAVPGEGADAYPRVGGLRLERGIRWNELEVGDTLMRLGEVDLRGVGYAGFDAIAMEQSGRARVAPLVILRDGVEREIELRIVPHERPWFRIPFLLSFVVVSLLILLRAPGSPHAQALFAAFTSFAIAECHFFGGPRLQSYASIYLFNFGGAVAAFLMFRWLILFPEEVDPKDRLSPHWAWLAILWIVVRLNYFLGGPIPPPQVPGAVLAVDALLGVTGLSIATWNYFHANRIGRRRFKWMVFGSYIGTTPWLATGLASYLGLPELAFHRMFEIFMFVQVAVPVGILIAVIRCNLFDIDRLLSSAASYTLAVLLLAGLTFSAVPAVAAGLSEATGWAATKLQLPIAASLVGAGILLGRRLRPQLDRYFFPERLALREGIASLLRDLHHCRSAREVIELAATRVSVATRATRSTLLVRDARGFVERQSGAAPRLCIASDSALVREFEADPLPRLVRDTDPPDLSRLDGRVLLPLRSGNDLVALVVLGPKRSGDVYTATEIASFGTVCERASAELLRLRDADALAAERGRSGVLEGLKDQAESTNDSRARFLAAASHDLRQPLHALGLFASALSERIGEEDAPELVRRIQNSTESLSEMLDALLDISRLDAGAAQPSLADFEVGPMVERLVSEMQASAAAKGLSLRVETPQARVRSDTVMLGRILQNLLTNAIRYTEQGGVSIRCRSEGDFVRIEVSDTGPGIPKARQEDIFGEFVRIEAGRDDGGLGLGLSIVDRMARLLGHELSLDSAPGRGATFAITVPGGGAIPTPARTSPVDFSGRLIAVVDDDLAVLDGTARLLRQWGCDVRLASSLDEALQSCAGATRPPDAMLLDYRLRGGVTGIDVAKQVNAALERPVPSAIITGETTRAVLEEIRACGLVHLTKPVAPFKLRAMLMEMLRA